MNILYISFSCNEKFGISSLRVHELLKFFSNKNHKITFVTPEEGFKVSGIKNIVVKPSKQKPGNLSLYYSNLIKPLFDESDSLYEESWVKDCENFLEKQGTKLGKFDVIIINIHPICLIKAGNVAKKIFNIPLIVDMQDPFFFNPYRRNLNLLNGLVKQKEQRLLKEVDGLVICQKSSVKVYSKEYPNIKTIFAGNIHPSNMPKSQNIKRAGNLKILYGGSLYVGRDLFPLLNASKSDDKYEIEVLGSFSALNRARYRNYPNIKWLTKIPINEYFEYLNSQVDIGVVLQSFAIANTGISAVASKTFEYLYLNKPIIYIGPDGDNADLIKSYSRNSLIITSPDKQQKELVKYLKNFEREKQNTKKEYYSDFVNEKVFDTFEKLLKELK